MSLALFSVMAEPSMLIAVTLRADYHFVCDYCQSPGKLFFKVLPKFGSMCVGMYMCMCVCMFVHAIVATMFILQLRNFGRTFLM